MTPRGRATKKAARPRLPAGERSVLTRERLEHFYNGSLFYTLAEGAIGREAGPRRAKRPRGAATGSGMPVAP